MFMRGTAELAPVYGVVTHTCLRIDEPDAYSLTSLTYTGADRENLVNRRRKKTEREAQGAQSLNNNGTVERVCSLCHV